MIISRDKKLLCPAFATILDLFEKKLQDAGLSFYLFMGLRTFEDQDELYAQGRTKPGEIVTNAKAGDSLHNYSLAADYVLDGQTEKPGIQWSWDTKADLNADGRNDWFQMGEIAENCGLVWGGCWKRFPDLPHVEMPGLGLNEIKELYRLGGIKRVWAAYETVIVEA
jgi:peptidoglycan L-alanyl-D-glutamate endopeptidase CwlK